MDQHGSSNSRSSLLIASCVLLLYFCASITLTLFNKWFFSDNVSQHSNSTATQLHAVGSAVSTLLRPPTRTSFFDPFHFRFPLTVTCFHQALVWLYVLLTEKNVLLRFGEITRSRAFLLNITPVGLLCGLDWGLSNMSLRFIPLSLYEMVKSASPLMVLGVSLVLGMVWYSTPLVVIFVLISAGMFLSVSGGDVSVFWSPSFPLGGFGCVCLATCLSGFRIVLAQRVMQKGLSVSSDGRNTGVANAVTTLYYAAPVSCLSLVLPALIIEFSPLVQYLQQCDLSMQMEIVGWILASSVLSFFLSLSEFAVTKLTSALTLCVTGITKQILIIGVAMYWFGDKLKFLNIVGFSLTLSGIALYNYIKYTAQYATDPLSPTAQQSVAGGVFVAVPKDDSEEEMNGEGGALTNGDDRFQLAGPVTRRSMKKLPSSTEA